MHLSSFKELFWFLLCDVYAITNQVCDELPVFIKKAHSEDLKVELQNHLTETKAHVKNIERIFKILRVEPKKTDFGRDIKALFSDAKALVKHNECSPLLDAAIIAILQRVEHVEIATYGTLKEYADVLDSNEIKSIINENLKEASKADSALNKLATGGLFVTGINASATRNV